jgi:hypothetical protein
MERGEKLLIYDWYTATLGQKSAEKHAVDSLKVNDLNLYFEGMDANTIFTGPTESD